MESAGTPRPAAAICSTLLVKPPVPISTQPEMSRKVASSLVSISVWVPQVPLTHQLQARPLPAPGGLGLSHSTASAAFCRHSFRLTAASGCPVQVASPSSQAFFSRKDSPSMPIARATLSMWVSTANAICGPDGQRMEPLGTLLV